MLNQLKVRLRNKLIRVTIENLWFIFYELWKLWLVIDGVTRRNTLTVIATIFLLFFSGGLGIMQLVETTKWADAPHANFYLQLALTIFVGTLAIPGAYIAYMLTKEYGWAVIERVGTERYLKDMYYRVQCFELLIKINLFFEVLLITFFAVITSLVDIDLTIGAAILAFLTLAMLMFARLGITYEAHWMMTVFFLFTVFIILVTLSILVLVTDSEDPWYTMCIYASASSIILYATLYTAIQCKMNFDKGLKPHIHWVPFRKRRQPAAPSDATIQESLLSSTQISQNMTEQPVAIPPSAETARIVNLESPTSDKEPVSPSPQYQHDTIDFTEYFDYLDLTKKGSPSPPSY
ncbi:hypothetical protein BX666DRAFT_1899193 [Dichotomocladium elegans]|nr:hypothetical protein BX666DRAFT_1899193 [Dichotomocladium elegans]